MFKKFAVLQWVWFFGVSSFIMGWFMSIPYMPNFLAEMNIVMMVLVYFFFAGLTTIFLTWIIQKFSKLLKKEKPLDK